LVCSTWFPNHLLLEGIGSYLDLLGRKRRPAVPRVQDTNNLAVVENNANKGLQNPVEFLMLEYPPPVPR
jgi:hypothetical protein